MNTVRIGILGAARIAPMALVSPSRQVETAEVTAIAARDQRKAEEFAAKRAIPIVYGSYEDLLADPDIDAVYIPLPNSLHAKWTLTAISARKHVLCEKPFTANAAEAEEVAAAAEASGLVVMEAFHYRYHPLIERMLTIIADGEIGTVRRIETRLCVPYAKRGDIRYRLDLAGGATMDVGCYAIHLLRTLGGASPVSPGSGETGAKEAVSGNGGEPTVESAHAKISSPGVDRFMQAEMSFADGRTGQMTCSLFSANLLSSGARIVGDQGEMRVFNATAPHLYHRLHVKTPKGDRTEHCGRGKTYTYQLTAFTDAILNGSPVLTPPSDSVKTMKVIDAIYEKSGLGLRGERTGEATT